MTRRRNNKEIFIDVLAALALALIGLALCSCAPVKVSGAAGQRIVELPPRPMTDDRPLDAVPAPAAPEEVSPGAPDEPAGAPAEDGVGAEPAAPPQVQVVKVLVLPDSSRVDARLSGYAEKLRNWKLLEDQIVSLGLEDRRPDGWAACLSDIEEIFNGYSNLLDLVLKQSSPSDSADTVDFDLWGVYYKDIAFLEGDCDRIFRDGASLVKGWLDRFSSKAREEAEEAVERYAETGKYEEAILAYNNLLSSYPGRLMSSEARRAYAISLLKTGRMNEAVEVLQDTVEQLPPSPERRSLERLCGDLLLSLGRADEAKEYYRKLAEFYNSRKGDDIWVRDQLDLLSRGDTDSGAYTMYQEVLRHYLAFDGRYIPEGMEKAVRALEEQYPGSPFALRARENLREVLDSARSWFEGKMAEIDRLVEAGEFDRARGVADMLLATDLSDATREMVQHTREEIDRAEELEIARQQELLKKTRESQWQEAESLLDKRDYDGAIMIYKMLYGTEYDEQARKRVVAASDRAASELRRKAAELFIKARRAADYDSKRQYFIDSWNTLAGIGVKYPDTTLMEKVRQNLEILARQIRSFDPDLLDTLENAGEPAAGADTPGGEAMEPPHPAALPYSSNGGM